MEAELIGEETAAGVRILYNVPAKNMILRRVFYKTRLLEFNNVIEKGCRNV
jgi:hypothetical protein